ncbi:hypothetical protein LINPERHAP1_LOCUS27137 [Linum perenne]
MRLMIYFTWLLVLVLAHEAQARTFPGDREALVIIYETRSSSPLDLSAILSSLNAQGRGPIPKSTPPSPKPAAPIAELTSDITSGGEAAAVERKRLTPPPTPKPGSPTHYIAPREMAPPGNAAVNSAWSLLKYYV